ncbi:hypothetical protein [Rubinisphaera brasiliensis]|uniref:Uncharacterized protein n=1 Tax=Rubinisphaera brasiliensis (strain ATCC 49424 / DSM 5305 / JCM 21570 / IAM 15109 / NBRC 103401 / IFAM 1448) TaxID=756272 RepID=F0SPG4_RUBBR|nr:hypothetical protein [Rubinisphaera brasiliensis]ADY57868.1 hypothetical protein Plabr_0239 [Rubinisphaera brasiliensis DSM 5305]
MPECICENAGYCAMHRKIMHPVEHDLCRNNPGYFDVFQKGVKDRPARGLGDTVAKITDQTGLKKLADLMHKMGINCGCSGRQKKWNRWFRYKQTVEVGITTAPREQVTLQSTVASLVENRWEPHIFAEPGSNLEGLSNLPIHQNAERLGAWRNWVHCCKTLLDTTRSKYILTVQDDTTIVPGAGEFLESFQWPDGCGMVSLYTPTQYTKKTPGCHRIRTNSLWGACAMLFRRDDLERLMDTKVATNWKGAPFKTRKRPREPWEVANVDTAVGKALREMGLAPFFFSPSLSQHIGATSSIGHKGMGPKRVASKVVADWSVFETTLGPS